MKQLLKNYCLFKVLVFFFFNIMTSHCFLQNSILDWGEEIEVFILFLLFRWLRHPGLQHTRTPCPSLSLRVYPNSWPLSQIALQPSPPLTPSSPFAFNISSIRVFSNELSVHIRPKYWSFSFIIRPSNEHSGLILFRIDWFGLAVQESLKSSLTSQFKSISSSALFLIKLSHLYLTTGKTIALTIWPFVGKMMPLFFNILSSFVIAFCPRIRHLLISWL